MTGKSVKALKDYIVTYTTSVEVTAENQMQAINAVVALYGNAQTVTEIKRKRK